MDRRPALTGSGARRHRCPPSPSRFVGATPLAFADGGEDLFNDATAIVIFGIFMYVAMHPEEDIHLPTPRWRFSRCSSAAYSSGCWRAPLLSRLFDDSIQQALVTPDLSLYRLPDRQRGATGLRVMVLVTGLIMGRVIHNDFQDRRQFRRHLWSFNVYVAEALVFLLMGVTVTLGMFEERWLAMLIGIIAILAAARAVGGVRHRPFRIVRLPGWSLSRWTFQRSWSLAVCAAPWSLPQPFAATGTFVLVDDPVDRLRGG